MMLRDRSAVPALPEADAAEGDAGDGRGAPAAVAPRVRAVPPPVPWAAGTRPRTRRLPPPASSAPPVPTVSDIYDRHAPFVWRVLRGLGVAADRLDDAVQDVFVVVHRRLGDFEGRSAVTTWLYGIARRVASQYRRSVPRHQHGADPDQLAGGRSPYEDARRSQAARLLGEILDELDDDKREVFVLIEIEQLSAPDVAGMVGIPVNTVYSRLRLARARFEAAVARRRAGEGER
jgi:RNA polymerase sigma-70 factor, ECF subfamily